MNQHLIQQCLSAPHAPPKTAASTVETLSHTYALKSPLVTMARPKFAPKNTPSRGPIPKPRYLPHPWTRTTYMLLNDIRIRYAVFPICTGQTDGRRYARTYVQTDRSSTGKFDDYRPLRYDSDEAGRGLIIIIIIIIIIITHRAES